jgi:hypothetical protein
MKKKIKFNVEVQVKLDSADAALNCPEAAGGGEGQNPSGGRSDTNCNMAKENKIADRSENGWATVKEYELVEISDDSEPKLRQEESRNRSRILRIVTNPGKREQPLGGATEPGLLLPATSIGDACMLVVN